MCVSAAGSASKHKQWYPCGLCPSPTSNNLVLQGLFDAAYFNAVFGNVYDQRDELLRTSLLLKPGQYAWSSSW